MAEPLEHLAETSAPTSGSKSHTARVAAAGLWGLIGRVAILFANLISAPFTIRLLGPARYGLWTLLQQAVTWAILADIGMSSGSTKFAAERYAQGDDDGESRVVWTALSITTVSTSFVALAIAVEAPYILDHVVRVERDLLGPGVVALRLVCGLFVAQAVSNSVNTPQLVRLRGRSYSIITNGAGLLLAVGTPVALAVLSGGVVTAAAVGLASISLGALAHLVLALRLQPAIRRPHVDRTTARRLLRYGSALTVSGIASIVLTTAQRLFLAHNHSTSVVAYYSVAATVGTTLYFLPEQVVAPLLPGLTKLAVQGRLSELAALYRKCLTGLFLLLTPAAIVLAFLARPFLSLWAGHLYGVNSTGPLLVILIGVWFNSLANVPLTYLLSSGHTKVIAFIQVAELGPYIAGAYLLTVHFGAVGAAVVWSATLAAQSIAMFVAARRAAPQLTVWPLSQRRLLSLAAPVALAAALGAASIVSKGLILRLTWAAGLGIVYAAASWRLVLTSGERQGLLSLASEVRKRDG